MMRISYKDILSVFLYKYHVFTLSFFIKGNKISEVR